MGEWVQENNWKGIGYSGSRQLFRGVSPHREAEEGPRRRRDPEAPRAAVLLGLCTWGWAPWFIDWE